MTRDTAAPERQHWVPGPRWVWGILVVVLLLLTAAAVLLRGWHERVRHERVSRHLDRAHELAAEHQLTRAADEYRAALSLDRDNPTAGRALALTLLDLGETAESESHLRELLGEDPTDGAMNRALARILAARGEDLETRAAYRRAIYGEWPRAVLTNRIDAWFEFIDYLRERGTREDVVAQLLQLRAELPPGQTTAARRAATLLVEEGAADLAIETLRRSALTAPGDVELLVQLADLEASRGLSAEARKTLLAALAVERRPELNERLRIVNRVLALDPTLPRLGLVARTQRAEAVLGAAVDVSAECDTTKGSELATVRGAARERLARRRRTDAEAAEGDLDLALRIWALAPACRDGAADARALGQVLDRVRATPPEPST